MVYLFDEGCPWREEDLISAVRRTINMEDAEIFIRIFTKYWNVCPNHLDRNGDITYDILRRGRYDLLEWLERYPGIYENLMIKVANGIKTPFNDINNNRVSEIICEVRMMSRDMCQI